MKYNSVVKEKVRKLRRSGFSLNQISNTTHVAKTTIRAWISDIYLSKNQKDILDKKVSKALQEGRIKAQMINHQVRVEKEKTLLNQGRKEIGKLTRNELMVVGIALYWAEGFKNKYEKRLGFCNSDPQMILFYLKWLREILEVDVKNITARVSINAAYKEKDQQIKTYWSKITSIPLGQFTASFYQNTLWKKEYFDDNYYGVLRIHVKESLDQLLKMRGWIEGIKLNA